MIPRHEILNLTQDQISRVLIEQVNAPELRFYIATRQYSFDIGTMLVYFYGEDGSWRN